MDQAALERAKASLFLKDFLNEETPTTQDGQVYDPVSGKWILPLAGVTTAPIIQAHPQQPPQPSMMQNAQMALPDFIDDMFKNYAAYSNARKTGGA